MIVIIIKFINIISGSKNINIVLFVILIYNILFFYMSLVLIWKEITRIIIIINYNIENQYLVKLLVLLLWLMLLLLHINFIYYILYIIIIIIIIIIFINIVNSNNMVSIIRNINI